MEQKAAAENQSTTASSGGDALGTLRFYVSKAATEISQLVSRKNTTLKTACEKVVKTLKECKKIEIAHAGGDCAPESVEIIKTMELACKTKDERILSLAINSLHKLMSFGFISGFMPIDTTKTEGGERMKAIDYVIEVISVYEVEPFQTVQLELMKACLTAVTAPSCDLHGMALMKAIRTCFNIYLSSDAPLTVATACGIIRQEVHHVFAQYEIVGAAARVAYIEEQAALKQKHLENVAVAKSIVDDIIDEVLGVEKNDEEEREIAVLDVPISFSGPVTSEQMKAIHGKSAVNIAFHDCYMLFRALCKLSMKETGGNSREREQATALKCRTFALELLYAVVENSGVMLRADSQFTEVAIRRQLCSTLIHNGVSTNPKVFKLSLSIFLSLMKYYSAALKAEIGVFFSNIFLRVLETPNSTIHQKWMVLQLLAHVCKNPQGLAEIYLNYDCDIGSNDVFMRMVHDLGNIAQGVGVPEDTGISEAQELAVKSLGLDCIVMVLKSLVGWMDEDNTQQKPHQAQTLSQPLRATSPAMMTAPLSLTMSLSHRRSLSSLSTDDSSASPATPSCACDAEDDDDVARFKQMKAQKQRIEHVKAAFALDAKKGIEEMKSHGMIDDSAASLARFFKDTEGIDKCAVGEFLGGRKQFNKDVLAEYVKCFDFCRMELDEAIRFFLGTFLLPGEGQVVDRIMESFGCRYYESNISESGEKGSRNTPSSVTQFADADAVYKLSFAIIMLATDLHNPGVKEKITLPGWIKMVNKDLEMGLDETYLRTLYERIGARPLELNAESGKTAGNQAINEFLSAKQRGQLFVAETSKWVDASMKEITAKRGHTQEYFRADKSRYVPSIFESIWAAVLVSLSIMLERSDAQRTIDQCLTGFRYAIHLAAVCGMETARTTFVAALEKFTALTNYREMRPKNIAAIKALVQVATDDGNYLGTSWCEVLKSISLLERLHLIGSGLKPDVLSPSVSPAPQVSPSSTPPPSIYSRGTSSNLRFSARSSSNRRGRPDPTQVVAQAVAEDMDAAGLVPQSPFTLEVTAIEFANSRAVSTDIDTAAIDHIFAGSVELSDSAVVEFVRALCQVSLSEVDNETPRTFCLQKIVEVASYNMNNRMRLVWNDIWLILQRHFIICGCHNLSAVSIFAIDSLRQLSMKYLEKDELANYNFQRAFLRPFALVAVSTQSASVKEYVVQCVRQLVLARTDNIKSGWKTIFDTLAVLSGEADNSIQTTLDSPCVISAYELLVDIAREHFEVVRRSHFTDLVAAFVRFARNPYNAAISKDAAQQLKTCTSRMVSALTPADSALDMWFPVFTGLASVVGHSSEQIRASALKTLFEILAENGSAFTPRVWELVFRGALLPMFDAVGYCRGCVGGEEDIEWLHSTCVPLMTELFALVHRYNTEVIPITLIALLDLLGAFIASFNSELVQLGAEFFAKLVNENFDVFDDEAWNRIGIFIATTTQSTDVRTCLLLLSASSGIVIKHSISDDDDDSHSSNGDKEEQVHCFYCRKDVDVHGDAEAVCQCPLCNAVYCSLACQRAHWPQHSDACIKPRTEKAPKIGDTTTAALSKALITPTMYGSRIRHAVLTPRDTFTAARMPNSPGSRALSAVRLSKTLVHTHCEAVKSLLSVADKFGSSLKTHQLNLNSLAACSTAGSALLASSRSRELLSEWGILNDIESRQQRLLERQVSAMYAAFEAGSPGADAHFFGLCADTLATSGDCGIKGLVVAVLEKMLLLDEKTYVMHIGSVYGSLEALIENEDPEVRTWTRKHFARIGMAFHISE